MKNLLFFSFILGLLPLYSFADELLSATNCQKSLLTIIGPQDGTFTRFWKQKLEDFVRLSWVRKSMEHHLAEGPITGDNFWKLAKAEINLKISTQGNGPDTIPKSGQLIIIANHPHGFTDGVVLNDLLQYQVGRKDVKTIANIELLNLFPQLADQIFPITIGQARSNARSLSQARKHLHQGGALIIFPAGDVEKLDLQLRGPIGNFKDRPWQNGAIRLAQDTGATVVPIFIHGHNSAAFHGTSLMADRLKKWFYLREHYRLQNHNLKIVIGPNLQISPTDNPDILTHQLQTATLMLGEGPSPTRHFPTIFSKSRSNVTSARSSRLAIAGPSEDYRADISLLEAQKMVTQLVGFSRGLRVVYGSGRDLQGPVLEEIGRAREITFRAALEGSGQERDLDFYDLHYLQFIILDQKNKIVGGYRVGKVREILETHGPNGLYTNQQFQFNPQFFQDLDGGILEIGRAFVIPEYQNSAALFMVWRALAEFLYNNPQYRHLIGAVSIPEAYSELSKTLILQYLALKHPEGNQELIRATNPQNPYHSNIKGFQLDDINQAVHTFSNLDQLGQQVAAIESNFGGNFKGIPPLITNYFERLDAKFITVDRDQTFQSVDSLIHVDTRTIPDEQFELFLRSKRKVTIYRQKQSSQ